MKFGLGVEVQPDSLFNQTATKYVPSVLDLMKTTTKDKFRNLAAPTSGTKKKINCYAVLIPSLAEAIQGTEMTPSELHIALVDQIRVMAVSDESTPATTTATF